MSKLSKLKKISIISTILLVLFVSSLGLYFILGTSTSLTDSTGASIGTVSVVKELDGKHTIDIEIDNSQSHLTIYGSKNEKVNARVDQYTGKSPEKAKIRTEVVAVEEAEDADIESIESATIKLEKKGKVDLILRCEDFDIDSFDCSQWERTDIPFEDKGDYIEFTVEHFSAYAGGEILAIDAVHLDADYIEISNIFSDIEAKDNVWSEAVYEGEFVRVSFEENLTNGRYIDVFVRSNETNAYFDVYEAGTGNKVGRSGIINREELQYIQIEGLTQATDKFDFKVVKVYPNPEDDSTDVDANELSFIEFDYIHDDFINATHADGLVVYGELNIASPRYRIWNASNAFSSELTALSVGTDGVSDIVWVVARGSHKRDELIFGTIDKSNDVNVQVLNSSQQWGNLLEVSSDVANSAFRGFDIAYEDVSGRALIVYEN